MRGGVIGLFLVLLASPLVGWMWGLGTELDENREAAQAPELTWRSLLAGDFPPRFEKFFDDHFVFRSILITSKNRIDYYVFNTSGSPLVHIGKDGWLYFRETLRSYLKDDCDVRYEMRQLARRLHLLERVLAASGRQFIFVVAPNKATIYPEHVGIPRLPLPCQKSRYDLFLDALAEYPVANFVRLDSTLIQAKTPDRPLYFKTDTHWNHLGQMIASAAVLRRLAPSRWEALMPASKPLTGNRVTDLAHMLSLDVTEPEAAEADMTYRARVSIYEEEASWNRRRPSLWITATAISLAPLLPRAVFYHDSFGQEMVRFLQGAFEQLDVYWTYNPLVAQETRESLVSSRIVVIEVVERNLAQMKLDPVMVAAMLGVSPKPSGGR